MSLKDFLKHRKEATNPAKISFRNAVAVLQSFFRKKMMTIGGLSLEPHIYEQIVWRRVRVREMSPRCWYSGACKVCGCDILGKTMEDRACSISEHPELLKKREVCYPAMMDKKTWESFKKVHKIVLFD